MIDNRSIWRAAHDLIEAHCDDAALQAAMKADDALERGDFQGQRVWVRVLDAIREIRHPIPAPGQRLN